MLEVHLLGAFEVKYKKKPIGIPSRPKQSLFAYLILHAGTSCRLQESLTFNQDVADPRGIIACLAGIAAVAAAREQFEGAAQLMGAVETQLASLGIRLLYMDKLEYDRNFPLVRSSLDEPTLKKFWSRGNAMSLEEAIRFAQETS